MLPDRSLLIEQKSVENANFQKFKCDMLKFIENAKNAGEFFFKPEACGQTVLPDRSLLIGQKLMKMPKFKT